MKVRSEEAKWVVYVLSPSKCNVRLCYYAFHFVDFATHTIIIIDFYTALLY